MYVRYPSVRVACKVRHSKDLADAGMISRKAEIGHRRADLRSTSATQSGKRWTSKPYVSRRVDQQLRQSSVIAET